MKRVLVGFCFSFVALASQADYLWWQLDNSEMSAIGSYAQELGLSSDQIAARVVALDGDNKKVVATGDPTAGFIDEWYTAPNQSIDISAFGDGAKGYSYYVEIVKADSHNTTIGYNTQAQAYTELGGSITTTLSDIPAVQDIWHGGAGSYKAAPEPTSAMLMLLGVAGLALRRKQRKLA